MYKSLVKDGAAVSVTPPPFYARRFRVYLTEMVFSPAAEVRVWRRWSSHIGTSAHQHIGAAASPPTTNARPLCEPDSGLALCAAGWRCDGGGHGAGVWGGAPVPFVTLRGPRRRRRGRTGGRGCGGFGVDDIATGLAGRHGQLCDRLHLALPRAVVHRGITGWTLTHEGVPGMDDLSVCAVCLSVP
jgi:hypothetical protein